MPNVDANVISFQCPKCGQDLQQTIGLLKSNQRLVCDSCGVGISFDTAKLAEAAEILQEALEVVPNEITIKFFR
jgi:transcription elongation factor Elf1